MLLSVSEMNFDFNRKEIMNHNGMWNLGSNDMFPVHTKLYSLDDSLATEILVQYTSFRNRNGGNFLDINLITDDDMQMTQC